MTVGRVEAGSILADPIRRSLERLDVSLGELEASHAELEEAHAALDAVVTFANASNGTILNQAVFIQRSTTAQVIPTGTFTPINDNDPLRAGQTSWLSEPGGATTVTVPTTGIYVVSWAALWSGIPGGHCAIRITGGGTAWFGEDQAPVASTVRISGAVPFNLTANDTITFDAWHNSGSDEPVVFTAAVQLVYR